MISSRYQNCQIKPYCSERNRLDKIRMDLNENAWGCSPKVFEAIDNIDRRLLSIYPEYSNVYAKLSERFGLDEKNIRLTNGADEAIKNTFDAFIQAGDRIVMPVPTFSMYDYYCEVYQGNVKRINYNSDFSFPTGDIATELAKGDVKLVIIVSPSNPLGNELSLSELEGLLSDGPDTLFLLDETYSLLNRKTYSKLITKYDNLIVIQSFSKSFGLSGLRIGALFANIGLINEIQKVMMPFSVNIIGAIAAKTVFDDDDFLEQTIQELDREKSYLYDQFDGLSIKSLPTVTNFIMIYLGENITEIYNGLRTNNILTKNLDSYPMLKGYLRITVRQHDENQLFIETLKKILQNITSPSHRVSKTFIGGDL